MKILFVTSIIPYPPTRGDKLRIYNIVKHFAADNQVKIISLVKNSEEKANADKYCQLGYDLSTVELPRIKGIFNLIRTLWTGRPLQVSYHHSAEMQDMIKYYTERNNYDIVYFHLFTVAQYATSVGSDKSLKIYDITDATALYLKRYIELIQNPFRKLFFIFELSKIKKYENISSEFDVNYVCSKVDLNYFQSRNINAHFRLFTNGFDSDYFKADETMYFAHRIIFVGSLPYFPNTDAALFFAKEVFPKIIQKFPDSKFYIVGQNPPREIIALNSDNIVVTGFVEDIKKEYLVSEVNVAPIRFGAGIQNKIIEALALGIPTVSSKLAVESFEDDIKKYIFTADSADDYVDAVCRIFSDSGIRKTFVKECSDLIRSKMTWEKLVGNERSYLESTIKNKN